MIDFTYNWRGIYFSKTNFDLCIKISLEGRLRGVNLMRIMLRQIGMNKIDIIELKSHPPRSSLAGRK
jgi:hypothetical protein